MRTRRGRRTRSTSRTRRTRRTRRTGRTRRRTEGRGRGGRGRGRGGRGRKGEDEEDEDEDEEGEEGEEDEEDEEDTGRTEDGGRGGCRSHTVSRSRGRLSFQAVSFSLLQMVMCSGENGFSTLFPSSSKDSVSPAPQMLGVIGCTPRPTLS